MRAYDIVAAHMVYPFPFIPLEEYAGRFSRVKLSREDGILTVRFHKDEAEFSWNLATHREVASLWNYIGMDPENKIILLTGTGNEFLQRSDYEVELLDQVDPEAWALIHQDAKKIVMDLVEIEQPIIVAVNGPVTIFSQIPMLCDIVLAVPEATFSEASHLPHIIPADGHHIIWPLLLGLNRAKYLLFRRQGISAQEALAAGIVGEIVSRERLLPRAYEIAHELLEINPVALRQMRPMLMQGLKRALVDGLSIGLLAEGYGALRVLPRGPQLGL